MPMGIRRPDILRQIRHKVLYGESAPAERQYRRRFSQLKEYSCKGELKKYHNSYGEVFDAIIRKAVSCECKYGMEDYDVPWCEAKMERPDEFGYHEYESGRITEHWQVWKVNGKYLVHFDGTMYEYPSFEIRDEMPEQD